MSEIIESVNISDTLRVASYFDFYAEGPFDWDLIKVQTLRHARDIRPLSSDDGHRAAIMELMEHNPHTGGTYASGWSTTARDNWERDAITKHLERAGLDCHFLQLVGSSQSEWADIVIYATAGDITEWGPIAREVKAWFAGEVYTLTLEERITYTAPNGNTLDRWELVDSVGSVYLLDGLTRDTAELYFDITAATVAA
jgi:hypothetical protein